MLTSIQDGALELLKDTARILSEFPNMEYCIIGGWCPVLRNKTTHKHPGTLDVDVLFRHSNKPGFLSEVIKRFTNSGFNHSAKHSFQLLRGQSISGQTFIYNVDFLHPKMLEDIKTSGLFVDHLELDVPLNNAEVMLKKACSIALPNSEVIFKHKMYTTETSHGVSFNLVDFNGMFLTKADSCQKKKRERDAFDIYLAFINDGIINDEIQRIAEEDIRIFESLRKLEQYLRQNKNEFNNNTKLFDPEIAGSPAEYIIQKLSPLNKALKQSQDLLKGSIMK